MGMLNLWKGSDYLFELALNLKLTHALVICQISSLDCYYLESRDTAFSLSAAVRPVC